GLGQYAEREFLRRLDRHVDDGLVLQKPLQLLGRQLLAQHREKDPVLGQRDFGPPRQLLRYDQHSDNDFWLLHRLIALGRLVIAHRGRRQGDKNKQGAQGWNGAVLHRVTVRGVG